jgi:hypothetical protein
MRKLQLTALLFVSSVAVSGCVLMISAPIRACLSRQLDALVLCVNSRTIKGRDTLHRRQGLSRFIVLMAT